MKTILTKEALFSYFAGNASALQKNLIAEWIRQPGNREIYYQYLEEFEKLHPQFLPDTDAALKRSLRRIDGQGKSLSPPENFRVKPARPRRLYLALKLACLAFACGWAGYYWRDRICYRYYETSYGELQSLMLSDSSSVVLNAHTLLKVPRFGFGYRDRSVYLSGEAEFHIRRRNDHMPFTVHDNEGNKVTVLGTEFVVYSRNHRTNVVLNKGKIQLTPTRSETPTLMEPGDYGSFTSDGSVRIRRLSQTQLSDRLAWKQRRFAFNHTPLSRIAADIEDVFGLQVQIEDPALAARELTGSYRARTAEELLEVLSEMLEVEIVKKNENRILLISRTLPE